ncbi:hypothetical protein A3C77_04485 [Candidatus Giovannonibacteria bacterium RIFCSPHIGHO2_02_FULL_45_13]|uniref:Uncharacterized protein n=1 Tax=Candidatus Giovannonibacteria bacterium RIFCSPHIGHO2_01_FULL_45_23 TaxID=1798325 RepID=A0A1F5VIF2_9BACT|nr:MAG: hypothetical protein A2834_03885 [Candidatus Giovannonibacteria bacterium RIFCSPHIGHO2_01_FULL_45_23]OGF75811.1 MAG: hypothetical protein A3C77_04485 [Candidatus Giovannonibacteria bacterium RIFCSPHIGHO2_02_FULL_45_13]
MFKGFVLSESLKNPTVLNKFDKIKVIVERHPEYPPVPIWHDFKLKITDKDVNKTLNIFAREMKDAWYAHFWNKKILYVVLPEKIFKMPLEKELKSKEYKKCREYAAKHGVEERYLNFWIED